MPSRILLMARELGQGGSERQMTEIARALDRAHFEPIVGCFLPDGDRGEELRVAGVPVVRFDIPSYKSAAAIAGARALARFIRSEKIDLVHSFDYPLNVFAVPVTRLLTRAVAVSSQRSHRGIVPRGYRQLLRLTDRLAHAIVVNCRYLEHHLRDDEGVPAGRIEVCPNGIDLGAFQPPPERSGPVTIGVVSSLWPWKGHATLLEAYARVRRNSRLLIVGNGSTLPDLKNQADRLGIGDEVLFQPGTKDVADALRQIDIFVLPSTSEAFSNAIMEAMACNCAVIASDVGGNPELVQHEQTGLLFPPGDVAALASALERLIAEPVLRRQLAGNAMRRIGRNYSVTASARRMGEIYSKLLGH